MTKRPRKRLGFGVLVSALVGIALVWVGPASGQTDRGIIEIPLDTVVYADPGTTVVIAEVAVPADLVGKNCTISSRAENNSSVHPGNDLVVASDGAAVELLDVEAIPGKVTEASERLVLGATASVSLRMGPDGVFSGGASALVVVQCFPPPPPSSSVAPTSTVAPTTTEQVKVSPQPSPPAQPQQVQPEFTG